jgi:DNA-binding MarR family transcriptional regulator
MTDLARLDYYVNQVYQGGVTTKSPLEIIYQAHRELTRLEQEPRDYGTARLCYASEIHTLACIGDNPYLNLTTLAMKLGVSKSAASKFVKKLMTAKYVEKTRPRDNDKEVLFRVTALGKRALLGHKKFEERTFGPLREIESRLSPGQTVVVTTFLSALYDALTASRDRQ